MMDSITITPTTANAEPSFFSHRIILRISNLKNRSIEFVATSPETLRQEIMLALKNSEIRSHTQLHVSESPPETQYEQLRRLDFARSRLPEIVERWRALGKTEDCIEKLIQHRISDWDGIERKIRNNKKICCWNGFAWHLHVKPSRYSNIGWHNIVGYPSGFLVSSNINCDWNGLWSAVCATAENDERLRAFAYGVAR